MSQRKFIMEDNQNNNTIENTSNQGNYVNAGATWPQKIIGTILFLHAGYVFLTRFGVDFTFPKKID